MKYLLIFVINYFTNSCIIFKIALKILIERCDYSHQKCDYISNST